METRKRTKPYPAELRDHAVRLVREHEVEHRSQWAAIRSIAEKVGCNAGTLRCHDRVHRRSSRRVRGFAIGTPLVRVTMADPICKELPIAPSTCRAHVARRTDPSGSPPRVRRDGVLRGEIRRVWEESFRVHGVRKVWRQLVREGFDVARGTVARLMRQMGLQGPFEENQRKSRSGKRRWVSARPGEPGLQGAGAEQALG